MKRFFPMAALALGALALGACDKPRTNSAYNNSGQSATQMMPAEPPAQAATAPDATSAPAPQPATSAPATSDTTSPAAPPAESTAVK